VPQRALTKQTVGTRKSYVHLLNCKFCSLIVSQFTDFNCDAKLFARKIILSMSTGTHFLTHTISWFFGHLLTAQSGGQASKTICFSWPSAGGRWRCPSLRTSGFVSRWSCWGREGAAPCTPTHTTRLLQYLLFQTFYQCCGMRIHEILVRIRIHGSIMDPDADPAILVSDLQDANKKIFFSLSFFCLLLFHGTFTTFLKDKKS
jgi:hypothetical protein